MASAASPGRSRRPPGTPDGRPYGLCTVFVAHTIDAWEFNEEEFFQVRGEGGTKTATGLNKALQVLEDDLGDVTGTDLLAGRRVDHRGACCFVDLLDHLAERRRRESGHA